MDWRAEETEGETAAAREIVKKVGRARRVWLIIYIVSDGGGIAR